MYIFYEYINTMSVNVFFLNMHVAFFAKGISDRKRYRTNSFFKPFLTFKEIIMINYFSFVNHMMHFIALYMAAFP